MSKVFISYRREDTAGYAQAVYGQLERHFRRDQIFMDVDTIDPGVDFVARIEQAVSDSDVVVALIGRRWMGELANATPRIHDPHDFVHLEIATALSRGIRIIPVLVDGASMPGPDGLPSSLRPLVRRQALELSSTRFRFDLERVSQAARKALVRSHRRWRPWIWYGGLSIATAAVVLGIAVSLWFKRGDTAPPATRTPGGVSQLAKRDAEMKALTDSLERTEGQERVTTPEELRRLEASLEELRKENAQIKTDIERQQKKKESMESELQKFKAEVTRLKNDDKVTDNEKKQKIEILKKQIKAQLQIIQSQ